METPRALFQLREDWFLLPLRWGTSLRGLPRAPSVPGRPPCPPWGALAAVSTVLSGPPATAHSALPLRPARAVLRLPVAAVEQTGSFLLPDPRRELLPAPCSFSTLGPRLNVASAEHSALPILAPHQPFCLLQGIKNHVLLFSRLLFL